MAGKELDGRTALVTGGARGIGRATCIRLAREGAKVAINYARNESAAREAQRLVEAEGAECMIVPADVSDRKAVAAMVASTEKTLGPIDLLVTSAGIAPDETRGQVAFEVWRRTMAVNLDGTFLAIMAVKDGMIARLRADRLPGLIAGLRPLGWRCSPTAPPRRAWWRSRAAARRRSRPRSGSTP